MIPNFNSIGESLVPEWGTPIPIYQSDPAYPVPFSIIQDSNGNIHSIWQVTYGCPYGCEVMYAKRDISGAWSDPEFVPMQLPGETYIGPFSPPVMLIDSSGNVHIIWTAHSSTGYTTKPAGGDWTSPIKLDYVNNDNGVIAHLGPDDSIHVMGKCTNTYLTRSPSGEWSSEIITFCPMDFGVDPEGTIHVLTQAHNTVFNLYYIKRTTGESWSSPLLLSSGIYDIDRAKIALDPAGNVHASWTERTTYDCFPITCTGWSLYHRAIESGVLSSPLFIDLLTGNYVITDFDIESSNDGTTYIMWQKRWEEIQGDPVRVSVMARKSDGKLSEVTHRDGQAGFIVVGWNNDVHVTWRDGCLKHQWYLPTDGWFEITTAGCLEGELYRIAPGNEIVPGSINSLFLVFMDRGKVYNFELIYNSFELANAPTPSPPPSTTEPPPQTTEPPPTTEPPQHQIYVPLVVFFSYP